MGSSPLDLYAREYFNSLNSIASKISADITTTVAAYEDLWHTLSVRDQHQVINETIMHPEVVLKYSLYKSEDINMEELLLPRSYCYDEGKGIRLPWVDEHSAPFSWKTRSQQDLRVICEESSNAMCQSNCRKTLKTVTNEKLMLSNHDTFVDPPNIVLGGSSSKLSTVSPLMVAGTDTNTFLDKIKSNSVVLKIQTAIVSHNVPTRNMQSYIDSGSSDTKVTGGCKTSKTLPSKYVSKPKIPPPPPPKFKKTEPCSVDLRNNSNEKDGFDELETNWPNLLSPMNQNVPKTGFDFLDNW